MACGGRGRWRGFIRRARAANDSAAELPFRAPEGAPPLNRRDTQAIVQWIRDNAGHAASTNARRPEGEAPRER